MFNNISNFTCKQVGRTNKNILSFFRKPNRSLVGRFINFTFGSNLKKHLFIKTYARLSTTGSFFSNRKSLSFNLDTGIPYIEFSWLFSYFWKLKVNDGCYVYRYFNLKIGHSLINIQEVVFLNKSSLLKPEGELVTKLYSVLNLSRHTLFSSKNKSIFYKKQKLFFRVKKIYVFYVAYLFTLNVYYGPRYFNPTNQSKKISYMSKLNNPLAVITDTTLINSFIYRKKHVSFFDLSPGRYINGILCMSLSRITPFAIKKKTFLSQREVHYSSICFFLEKKNFIYKNSYFLGLMVGSGKPNNYLTVKVFKLFTYSFSRNSYAMSKGHQWLS